MLEKRYLKVHEERKWAMESIIVRQVILKLRNEGKAYSFIAGIVGCSEEMISNAIKLTRKPETERQKT